MSLVDIQQKIQDYTAACVESSRNSESLGGFIALKPRKAYEPGCKQKANAMYANELAAAEREKDETDAVINDAFIEQLINGNTDTKKYMVLLVIVVLIIVVIIYK